jgi:hypothetical protein
MIRRSSAFEIPFPCARAADTGAHDAARPLRECVTRSLVDLGYYRTRTRAPYRKTLHGYDFRSRLEMKKKKNSGMGLVV